MIVGTLIIFSAAKDGEAVYSHLFYVVINYNLDPVIIRLVSSSSSVGPPGRKLRVTMKKGSIFISQADERQN